jgi:hypothetical protein
VVVSGGDAPAPASASPGPPPLALALADHDSEAFRALDGSSGLARPNLEWAWRKIGLLQQLVEQRLANTSSSSSSSPAPEQWILMVDLDAFVMNMEAELGELLAAARAARGAAPLDLVVSCDCNGMQTGVFLLRASAWSRDFLAQVQAARRLPVLGLEGLWEQAAMHYLLGSDAAAARHVALLPQRAMNAYRSDAWGVLSSHCHYKWRPGDFMIHFVDYSKKRMEKWVARIQDVNSGGAAGGTSRRRRRLGARRQQRELPG